jgi:hypothetical protein
MLYTGRNRLGIWPGKCGTCCAHVRDAFSPIFDRGGAAWRLPRFVSAGMGRGLMTARHRRCLN